MITIFTPSFADAANTNAQNLTVKEVVCRLPADRFKVILLGDGAPDPRIRARPNTTILRMTRHGNSLRWLSKVLSSRVDIYFFPREGPLDSLFMHSRRQLNLSIALITYIVMALDEITVGPIMQRAIRQADDVVGNSLYVSRTIKERFGIDAETIYDGVNSALFNPAPIRRSEQNLTVFYAGSLQARKRVDLVIREAAKFPAAEFRLAGKGEEEARLRALASELRCGNVTFLGHLSQMEVAEEMRRADVFLFPSILEGHPQVLGQAASSGLPVIAMEKYHPDYVVNGETGHLVKSHNELSSKLGLLMSDHELRRRMSVAAVRHASQFTWDKVAQNWERIFERAVARRNISH